MARILVIEDEPIIRQSLTRLLEREGHEVIGAPSLEGAEDQHELGGFELILSDLRLPGEPGTRAIERAPGVPVIILTSYASVRSAVEAMKQGAVDYVPKPFDHDELLLTVSRALEHSRLRRQNQALRSDVARAWPIAGLIGESPSMQAVFEHIRKIAPTEASVLVRGESGTGKELVTRALHARSPRADAPLVAVNCAAIPEEQIEAELFGHEKGAFSGALSARPGLIESAAGGTLFLDEVGELPLAAQARLLRVLQEGEIRRLGGASTRRVDVRVIAATHENLEQMVAAGSFREDLYFRIRVMEITLPPLRERGADIGLLAEQLLAQTCERQHRPPLAFTDEARHALQAYSWPGNVRELQNAVERAVILAEGERLGAADLGLSPTAQSRPGAAAMELSLEDYFRAFVREHEGRLTETELARRLGISRKALWEKRQRLGLPRPAKQETADE